MENKTIFKSLFTVIVGIMLIFAVQPSYDSFADKPSDKGKANAKVSIPKNAIKVAPGVYSLGEGVSQGKIVQGFMFIDYKKGFGHNADHTPGPGGDNGPKCYKLFAKDAKWKGTESWLVNPINSRGLGDNFVLTTLSESIDKWEGAASLTTILGSGSITSDTLSADTALPIDNFNEVYFADIASPGAIAVTIVWGIFNGPPSDRVIVSWDQVYDDVSFDWTSDPTVFGEGNKMDFENIVTHELGHSVGLTHPNGPCEEETMFASASAGETNKRTLNAGDIRGINALY